MDTSTIGGSLTCVTCGGKLDVVSSDMGPQDCVNLKLIYARVHTHRSLRPNARLTIGPWARMTMSVSRYAKSDWQGLRVQ